ncbi:MAG: NAD(P)/FAD-dependent oxidoreductase [Actinomycetota bacterium]
MTEQRHATVAGEAETFDALVLGAGVAGIYQIKRLVDLGLDAVVLEADEDLGGTWYRNRYPGARFDSESYTYGYSWSQEVLDRWHWKERFSPQPETLRYLNFVAETHDLRRHMRFGRRVASMTWIEDQRHWAVVTTDGERYLARWVITGLGALSVPTMPKVEGIDAFGGSAFHTYDWPRDGIDLSDKRVGIIGTGATAIQIIAAIADTVGDLTVFQRRPNWSVPLRNSAISAEEMEAIRSRYAEIFANCAATPGGFEHVADRRNYDDLTPEQRRETWDELYDAPGFALQLANFPDTFFKPEANQELSDYVADRIRQRVDDPEIAEKLIPRDHGFGYQRLPLETNYFEAYNRPNVHLVDVSEDPIDRVTPTGIRTRQHEHELDVLIFATGFHAMVGAFNRIDVVGVGGLTLKDAWADNPDTYLGTLNHGFPNLFMIAGPQSASGSTNYPRALETGVAWISELLEDTLAAGHSRVEVTAEGQAWWSREVRSMQDFMPFGRTSKSWFTGYNSNVAGHEEGNIRYQAYWGGAPRFRAHLEAAVESGYGQIDRR